MAEKPTPKKKNKALFEHTSKPLLDARSFYQRQLKFMLYAFAFLAFFLGIGMIGYHILADLDWVSSYHNATMILSGMGEIDSMPTNTAKIFSGTYALVSGVIFLVTIAVMLSPIVHRFLHRMHVEEPDEE
jgi:hypothetical protein